MLRRPIGSFLLLCLRPIFGPNPTSTKSSSTCIIPSTAGVSDGIRFSTCSIRFGHLPKHTNSGCYLPDLYLTYLLTGPTDVPTQTHGRHKGLCACMCLSHVLLLYRWSTLGREREREIYIYTYYTYMYIYIYINIDRKRVRGVTRETGRVGR